MHRSCRICLLGDFSGRKKQTRSSLLVKYCVFYHQEQDCKRKRKGELAKAGKWETGWWEGSREGGVVPLKLCMLNSCLAPASTSDENVCIWQRVRRKLELNAVCLVCQMAGRVFANWWSKMGPYYTKAYQEMWVGMGLIGYFYYKLSYGGESGTKKDKMKLSASLLCLLFRADTKISSFSFPFFCLFRQKGCEEQ